MKQCSTCEESKSLDEFHKDRGKADGRVSICKACKSAKDIAKRRAQGIEGPGRKESVPHGTQTMYGRGCRCEPCRGWKRENNRKTRKRKDNLRTTCYDCGTAIQPRSNPEARCKTCLWRNKPYESKARSRFELALRKAERGTASKGKKVWHVDVDGIITDKPRASCLWCESTFYGARKYCNRSCLQAMKKFNRRGRMKGNGNYQRIDRARVMMESNNVCGICYRQIDTELKFPHPDSPSIDHIIALANGGEHNYANVQAAHLLCNSTKSDRLDYLLVA